MGKQWGGTALVGVMFTKQIQGKGIYYSNRTGAKPSGMHMHTEEQLIHSKWVTLPKDTIQNLPQTQGGSI